jgi:hypothetical protein
MFFSVLGIGLGTVALFSGKLDSEHWVELVIFCMASHHAEDWIKAWRGNASSS